MFEMFTFAGKYQFHMNAQEYQEYLKTLEWKVGQDPQAGTCI